MVGPVTRSRANAAAVAGKTQTEFEFGRILKPGKPEFRHFWSHPHDLFCPENSEETEGQHGSKSNMELDAICLMGFIREQEGWETGIRDTATVAKWVLEVQKILQNRDPAAGFFTPASIEYVLAELKYVLETRGPLQMGTVDGTWMADFHIPEDLNEKLLLYAGILENSIPKNKRGLHGDSHKSTGWSMVNPYMYPVATPSTISKEPYFPPLDQVAEGRGNLIHYPERHERHSREETEILAQWIPFHNPTLRFLEYCASCSDGHTSQLVFRWLPSEFEVGYDKSVRIRSYINNLHPEVHSELYTVIEEIFGTFIPLFEHILTDLKHPAGKRFRLDDEEAFERPMRKTKKHMYSLAGRNLQVVTQLSNVELTPECPGFRGNFFHYEGLSNDMIVAAGVYYYSVKNITESRVEFRKARDCCRFKANQTIGDVLVKEGRCVAFPNTLKNRDLGFTLGDPSRPGHRKCLKFFLVDPSVRVISTAYVPPRQPSWFVNEILKKPICLPPEMVELILLKTFMPMKGDLLLQEAIQLLLAMQEMHDEIAPNLFEVERGYQN